MPTPEQNEVPTPRTDAFELEVINAVPIFDTKHWYETARKIGKHARTLEKELIELRRLADSMFKHLPLNQQHITSYDEYSEIKQVNDAYKSFLARHPEIGETINKG